MTRTWATVAVALLGLGACGSDRADTLDGITTTTVAPSTTPEATDAASVTTAVADTSAVPETTGSDSSDTDSSDTASPDTASTQTATTEDTDTSDTETSSTGANDAGTSTTSTPKPTTTSGAVTTTVEELPPPNTVAVGLSEYAISMPDTIPSGPTMFTALNGGTVEHHMTILKYGEGETLGDVLTILSTDPAGGVEAADLYAGPQAVTPGQAQSATTNLQPGGYLALCVIPDKDGIAHAAKGMLKEFTVTGPEAADDRAVPATPGIVLKEYGFTLPEDFTGDGLYRVENQGTKPHELAIYRVADGATIQDAENYLTADPTSQTGESPVIPSGGLTPISPGSVGGTVLHLTKGTYVFVCFLPGTDHLTHLQHGMIREVDIGG